MFVKQKNVWLRNYKVMDRLQAHHFFFFDFNVGNPERAHHTLSGGWFTHSWIRLNLVRSWFTPHEKKKEIEMLLNWVNTDFFLDNLTGVNTVFCYNNCWAVYRFMSQGWMKNFMISTILPELWLFYFSVKAVRIGAVS